MLDAWTSTWRTSGLGAEGPAPPALGAIGAVELAARGRLRPRCARCSRSSLLPIGILGAWRLARPIGSLRAGIAAFVVYAAVPVPYNALARGSWGGLVAYAVAPWVVLQLARASQLAPYGRGDLDRRLARGLGHPGHAGPCPARSSSSVSSWPWPRRSCRSSSVLGLVTAVALALGSLVAGRPGGAGRMLVVGAGATLTAGVLHLPWTWDLVGPDARWDVFAGIGSTDSGDLSAASLLRFETGPHGGVLGYALLIAAALPHAHRAGLALRVGGAGLVRGPGRVGARAGSARRAGSRRAARPPRC